MKIEFTNVDRLDIKPPSAENYRSIKPEKEMSINELNDAVRNAFSKAADIHSMAETSDKSRVEKNIDPSHKDCLTTSAQRKEYAGYSKGDWSGEVGNSKILPEKAEAREALKKYKVDGIEYRDGEPDFSKVSEQTVQIDGMTSNRPSNFHLAEEECAKIWNEQARDDRTNWSGSDIAKWRKENGYSWHERLDMKTMDLVQRDIHEECKHFGGVSEWRKRELLKNGMSNRGGFDE